MTLTQLNKLVAQGESETLEWKETTGQRGDACETLCAFLNGSGGTVVFGVSKKGKITGQLIADKTRRELFEVFQKFEPAADVEVEWVPVDETHQAVACRVERGNGRPYVYDGRPYKRVQSSTTVMRREEYNRMLKEREGFQSKWEDQVNLDLGLADLDQELIRETARRAIQCGRLDAETNPDDIEGILDGFKLRKKGALINAAAVLFGRPEKVDYPQLEAKMGWFKGVDERMFLDNRHVQGPIFKLIDEAIAFCFKHLNLSAKITGKIERDEELEIPADALREVLINAFAHRSYEETNRTVYLAIYDDRVEIKNPGRFPDDFDVDNLYRPPLRLSLPRNEKIARVLYLRKTIETWGRGLTRIAEECRRVGMPMPVTTVEHGSVVTVFRRPDWARTGTTPPTTGTGTLITGTGAPITGTGWVITGTGVVRKSGIALDELMAMLPRIRKDARQNAETVLQEIIEDNCVTIPQICARTGMALRTINNALSTLREAKIIKQREAELSGIDQDHTTLKSTLKSAQGGMKGGMKTQDAVLALLQENPEVSIDSIAVQLKRARSAIIKHIDNLKTSGRIRRVGPDKGGRWEVVAAKGDE